MKNNFIGRLGESAAAEYLESKGFSIISMNLHISHDEIDIIAENEDFIVFVEVKTRTGTKDHHAGFGRPAAAVNYTKRQRILRAARSYLRQNPTLKQPRIDVIEVYVTENTSTDTPGVYEIVHIRNSFGGRA